MSFLPLPGFGHFADFALDQVAFKRAEMADVEFAVEMIGFVEEGAGEKFFSGSFVDFAAGVLRADGDFAGATHILAKLGNAEAAFALGMLAFGVNDFRVD